MPRIPLGDFGNRVAEVGLTPTAQPDNQIGNAFQHLAGTGVAVADQALTEIDRQQRVQKAQDDALARSNAADGLIQYQVQSRQATQDIKDQVQTGQLPYAEARGALDNTLSSIKAPTFGPGQNLVAKEYARGAELHRFQAGAAVDMYVNDAKRSELKANFNSALDGIGKVALMPGSTLDGTFADLDKIAPMGRAAGMSEAEVGGIIQNQKDNLRYDRAESDMVASRGSPEALGAMKARLESGDLSTTIDPGKRIALLREVDTLSFQAQNQAQHATDKREAVATRAVAGATKQIEAGVPLTAAGWTAVRAAVDGTSSAGAFNELAQQEAATQRVLRMPMADQQTYVQQREAQLMQDGGTPADKGNLQRIKTTIENNKTQLETAPLLAAQRLYGRPVQPLNFDDLMQPGGPARAAAAFTDRSTTLSAMSKQYGTGVGTQPLLPQEASALVKMLDQASPTQATQFFSALRGAVNDDDTYRATMQQIAPDSPVKARAGVLAALDRQVTTQANMLSPDVRVSSATVAETMLAGEQLLNRTKGQKAEDGKPKSLFIPPAPAFQAAFSDAAGDLYRSRPGAQEGDLQAAMAYYVGKASQTGRLTNGPGDIDSGLVKEAMTATLGALVNVNGQGTVKAPLGMSAGDMQAKLRERFAEAVRAQGLPDSVAASYDHYGAVNYRRDGQYMLTLGGVPVLGKDRQPVVLDLDPPPVTGSRYRRGSDEIPAGGREPAMPDGMTERGNIDLTKRPVVKNSDGSISTVRSMGVNFDGQEVLIPMVVGNKVVSDEDAIKEYLKTGKHLGKFKDAASSTAYAEHLHEAQARQYGATK